ncbi:MAG TPA: alpha/beta fold hydrolase [Turneriella sp.]|nr:alpha/beta fold hydrolase [Turneriella sp.]
MLTRSAEQNLRYPLLLVHGLFSSSRTWRKTVRTFVDDYDLRYGGEISMRPVKNPLPVTPGDFYTWNFSSNHNLSYRQQAEELARGIRQIRELNSCEKVVIAGHSMGGLAARALVQLYGAQEVFALITLGTPHYGSPLALLREATQKDAQRLLGRISRLMGRADNRSENNPGMLRRALMRMFRVTTEAEAEVDRFFSSEAFVELAPGSAALEELNRAELPESLRYVFITGSLTDFAAFPDAQFIARYRKLNSFWKRMATKAVNSVSNRYLLAPYEEFRTYLSRYQSAAAGFPIEQLMDFDGAVPVMSQMIHHFRNPPLLKVALPVFASHNRLTKRPHKLFHALAVCGAVGASAS